MRKCFLSVLLFAPLIACAREGLVVNVVSVLAQPASKYEFIRVKVSIYNPSTKIVHGTDAGGMCERYQGDRWIPQITSIMGVFDDITIAPHQTVYRIVTPFPPGCVPNGNDPEAVLTYPIRIHVGSFEVSNSHEQAEGCSETLQPKDYLLQVK